MTCQWYYLRIRFDLSAIIDASKKVHPANRNHVGNFLNGYSMNFVQDVLCGIQDVDGLENAYYWKNSFTFMKFKDYIMGNENRFKTVLRRISYWIDQDNTLITVTGGGRPEKVRLGTPTCYMRGLVTMPTVHSAGVASSSTARSLDSQTRRAWYYPPQRVGSYCGIDLESPDGSTGPCTETSGCVTRTKLPNSRD